jgi:hypothetical protein
MNRLSLQHPLAAGHQQPQSALDQKSEHQQQAAADNPHASHQKSDAEKRELV